MKILSNYRYANYAIPVCTLVLDVCQFLCAKCFMIDIGTLTCNAVKVLKQLYVLVLLLDFRIWF